MVEALEFWLIILGMFTSIVIVFLAGVAFSSPLKMARSLGMFKISYASTLAIVVVFAATSYFDLYEYLTPTTLLWMRGLIFVPAIAAGIYLLWDILDLSERIRQKGHRSDDNS